MQAVIGNNLIKSLRPLEKPYEVRDARLTGFLLRVQPSGVMAFYVEYARGKRVKIGRADALTPAQARTCAKDILAEAYQGRDPAEARRRAKAHTLESYIDFVYAPWAQENIRTADATVRRITKSFPDLLQKKLVEINPWLVEKWRMSRFKTGVKPITVNRELTDLKSCLAKAVAWGFIDVHPIAHIKPSKVDSNPVVRYLSEEEERRLRAALNAREERIRRERQSANAWRRARGYPELLDLTGSPFADHLKPMVLVSLNTGVRRGELFALRWEDVDFDRPTLTIRGASAKSGRTRHISMNLEAVGALKGWQRSPDYADRLVFPARNGVPFDNVRRSWACALDDAGITGFRWHDLRHTFASRLVMRGVDLNTVRELLGHSSYQMTLRYTHLAPAHKAAAVAVLERN